VAGVAGELPLALHEPQQAVGVGVQGGHQDARLAVGLRLHLAEVRARFHRVVHIGVAQRFRQLHQGGDQGAGFAPAQEGRQVDHQQHGGQRQNAEQERQHRHPLFIEDQI